MALAGTFSLPYQNIQQAHQALTSATDLELKRRYLALLPPTQVIEICLTFDLHVPAHLKTTIWPTDLAAAIAVLQKVSAANITSSQTEPKPSTPTPHSQDPPKPPSTPAEAPGPPVPSSSASTSYLPQRFAYASQPAYPHTPYYPQPSWTSSFAHTPYGGTTPYAPSLSHLPHSTPYYPEGVSSDDLPSYEDMIVEALHGDIRDPEGLAPKDLYTWMAAHYPVQANFRPSASQALQKAYKRGRFEKSPSGKYRLNPQWTGGHSTRRTTRRPQIHATSPSASQPRQPLAAPFTNSPLSKTAVPQSDHNSSYALGYPSTSSQSAHSHNDGASHETQGDLGEAYEAAQHILKAINFGELFKITPDAQDSKEGIAQQGKLSTAVSTSATQAGPSILRDAAASSTSVIPTIPPDLGPEAVRAELQAQLALLAAQLSEIAEGSDTGTESSTVDAPISTPAPTSNPLTTVPALNSGSAFSAPLDSNLINSSAFDAVAAAIASLLAPGSSIPASEALSHLLGGMSHSLPAAAAPSIPATAPVPAPTIAASAGSDSSNAQREALSTPPTDTSTASVTIPDPQHNTSVDNAPAETLQANGAASALSSSPESQPVVGVDVDQGDSQAKMTIKDKVVPEGKMAEGLPEATDIVPIVGVADVEDSDDEEMDEIVV